MELTIAIIGAVLAIAIVAWLLIRWLRKLPPPISRAAFEHRTDRADGEMEVRPSNRG